MAIKLNVRGIEITVSTTAEAAALIRDLTEAQPSKIGRPKAEERAADLFSGPTADEKMAHSFLSTIAVSGSQGVPTEDIMKVLEVDAGRGIGGRCVKINNLLSRLGFNDPKEVYVNPKLAAGRVWRPGPRIHEAIERLKAKGAR